MPSADDLQTHATSDEDFYELLSLAPTFAQRELDRAWRRTALKYHPDKAGAADETARAKFHLANIAYEILSDPALRATYDAARGARARRRQQLDALDADRRAKVEALETRERAAGQARQQQAGPAWDADFAEHAARVAAGLGQDPQDVERQVRRLQEESRALMARLADRWAAERQSEQEEPEAGREVDRPPLAATDLDRTVKVRLRSTRGGGDDDNDTVADDALAGVRAAFTAFGRVESAFLLKERRARESEGSKKKKARRTVAVVFQSLVGACDAVDGWAARARAEPENAEVWGAVDSVGWAAGVEPAAVADWAGNRFSAAAVQRGRQGAEKGPTVEELAEMRARGPGKGGAGQEVRETKGDGGAVGSVDWRAYPAKEVVGADGTVRKIPLFRSWAGNGRASEDKSKGAKGGGLEGQKAMKLKHEAMRRQELEELERRIREDGDEMDM